MLCAVMDLRLAYEAEARFAAGFHAWTREALRHARRHEEALDCLFLRAEKALEAERLLPARDAVSGR